MPHVRLHAPFADGFARIRERLGVPEAFPSDVLAEAHASTWSPEGRRDLTGVPLVAIDPPGAVDLDQAFWGERRGDGFLARYAIADVGAFVRPGGRVDDEARERGVTLYSPDLRTPLHPVSLSENRASLLPSLERPALVWSFDLDSDGVVRSVSLERAVVRVTEAISYAEAQRRIDIGIDARLAALAAVGVRRIEQEKARGGVSMSLPTQRVATVDGGYVVEFDEVLPVERWNAQISLMTGMEAATIMGEAGVGIVRTLPDPEPKAISSLRALATALGLVWPEDVAYPGFVRSIEPSDPHGAAFLFQAARTLRGAGYATVIAGEPLPEHGAIAAPYAHVTAPLRRLVDRFANEILLAVTAGAAAPGWAMAALGTLPEIMASANGRQRTLERAVVDFTEAVVLQSHVGDVFEARVVDLRNGGRQAVVMIDDHAVIADLDEPGLELGTSVRVLLERTDPDEGRIDLRLV